MILQYCFRLGSNRQTWIEDDGNNDSRESVMLSNSIQEKHSLVEEFNQVLARAAK